MMEAGMVVPCLTTRGFFRQEFTSSPEVQQGMKRAFLRLAGLEIAENAVKLNWACAAQALSQITAKLRRLGEKVTLCFEIEIEGETKSMDACKVLSSTSPGGRAKKWLKLCRLDCGSHPYKIESWGPLLPLLQMHVCQQNDCHLQVCQWSRNANNATIIIRVCSIQGHGFGFEHVDWDWATGAQKVIKQELLEAGADDSIELVNWEPDPNPKSFNPNTDVKSSMPFSPINKGFNLGWHWDLMCIFAGD